MKAALRRNQVSEDHLMENGEKVKYRTNRGRFCEKEEIKYVTHSHSHFLVQVKASASSVTQVVFGTGTAWPLSF